MSIVVSIKGKQMVTKDDLFLNGSSLFVDYQEVMGRHHDKPRLIDLSMLVADHLSGGFFLVAEEKLLFFS